MSSELEDLYERLVQIVCDTLGHTRRKQTYTYIWDHLDGKKGNRFDWIDCRRCTKVLWGKPPSFWRQD